MVRFLETSLLERELLGGTGSRFITYQVTVNNRTDFSTSDDRMSNASIGMGVLRSRGQDREPSRNRFCQGMALGLGFT